MCLNAVPGYLYALPQPGVGSLGPSLSRIKTFAEDPLEELSPRKDLVNRSELRLVSGKLGIGETHEVLRF